MSSNLDRASWPEGRDPKRIQRILNLLEHAWNRYPGQRLGQLYANVTEHHRDVFYIEDDAVEAGLNVLLDTGEWPSMVSGSVSAQVCWLVERAEGLAGPESAVTLHQPIAVYRDEARARDRAAHLQAEARGDETYIVDRLYLDATP